MKKNKLNFLIISMAYLGLSLAASGCTTSITKKPVIHKKITKLENENHLLNNKTKTNKTSKNDQENYFQAPINEHTQGNKELLDTPARLPINIKSNFRELRSIYFDFDKIAIKSNQIERIEKNAIELNNNPEIKILIEGNCDDRGTNEYNMALGEKRAARTKNYLINLGVKETRISTISYGEEKPYKDGQNELSWSLNRRADIVENNL
jgi:peptidoglycan-associated lipoprotein